MTNARSKCMRDNVSETCRTARVVVISIVLALIISQSISSQALAQPYYPYGGGFVAGYVLGFNVYDELIPISWATITATVDSQVVGQTSSLGGGYFEMFLPVGFCNLTVEEYGFIPKTMSIFVSSGSSTTLQFILEQGERVYSYDVIVNVEGFGSGYYTNLEIDGQYSGLLFGGTSRTFAFKLGGSHQIEVDPYVNGSSGIRYHSTNVNRTANDRSTITFTYEPEYYLEFQSETVDFPSIEGWYEKGTLVETPIASLHVNGTAGSRYVFEYWTIDGREVGANPVSVAMDKPHNLSIQYRVQYYVSVDSEYGSPVGSGWYDAGSSVEISVTSPQGFGLQKVFDHWEGDEVPDSPTVSILANSPKTLVAVWREDYTQIYVALLVVIAAALAIGLLALRRKTKAKTQPVSDSGTTGNTSSE